MNTVVDLVWIGFGYADAMFPRWLLAVIALALVGVAARGFWANRATDHARRLLKQASRQSGLPRDELAGQALAWVQSNPQGLAVVADWALEAGLFPLARTCLHRLRELRALPEHRKRIERALDGPMPGSPMEAIILLERLIEQNQHALAQERLDKCLARWPRDAELRAFSARISSAIPADLS